MGVLFPIVDLIFVMGNNLSFGKNGYFMDILKMLLWTTIRHSSAHFNYPLIYKILSLFLSVRLCVGLYFSLYVRLSVCMYDCLSICLSVFENSFPQCFVACRIFWKIKHFRRQKGLGLKTILLFWRPEGKSLGISECSPRTNLGTTLKIFLFQPGYKVSVVPIVQDSSQEKWEVISL